MKSVIPSLMVQGTTSDAGKSVLVAGLCRVLARRGVKIAPFKPQNMALNSAVTKEGGEIGRAQAVQAQACFLKPSVDMNPVLIKPNSDTGAQIILQGKALTDMDAVGFHDYKKVAMSTVLDSFSRLTAAYDTVLVEGAGSPAEINLRENDIANMGFAEAADVPVIIIADIDRGGVFAHLYGTLALLSASEQARIQGFVINRFRGDISLLQSALDWLEEKTGKPVLGVLPYLHGLNLEAEDAITEQQVISDEVKLNVVVPILPRISNHTDFDALRLNPDINLRFVGQGEKLERADLIVLPGSKSVRADLEYLRRQGWDQDIQRHLRLGGRVLGICGGYQMLGKSISDPLGVEGQAGTSQGLGLLDVETVLTEYKRLTHTEASLCLHSKPVRVKGYEIHVGESKVRGCQPLLLDGGSREGAMSECGQVLGTYLHGLFDEAQGLAHIAEWVNGSQVKQQDFEQLKEQGIERIADAIEQHMNLDFLFQ
ncbi:cobyric acid synthase [Vibrio sp. CAU 1672]|uniref:cobyric acid synthase n=1 Tax=Vibrio sp. CAU 1672 TaxID=3032594 RepID=UPI0023DAD4B9|nr:cobyric acid synthase [Vibrio sp. CAU 1672]MDF2154494.1 cobyric acid synthase [Vibrio sp. CAU 1672]